MLGKSLRVGRANDSDVIIEDDSVSRRHALITFDGKALYVEDLGSTRGTVVRGKRIPPGQRIPIEAGELFSAGDVLLKARVRQGGRVVVYGVRPDARVGGRSGHRSIDLQVKYVPLSEWARLDAPDSLTALNLDFMRCTVCHQEPELKGWLLTGSCTAEPALRVPPRERYVPRGWGGSLAPPPRPLVILSTNPGHPLPEEDAFWSEFPSTPATARSLSHEQALKELDFASALYRRRTKGHGKFHTRSVQMARIVLWLMRRAGIPLAEAWFDNVWFSDVVKCSTAKEQGSPGIPTLARACRPLLERELEVLKPRLVVTLGDSAASALKESRARFHSVIALPHPERRGLHRLTHEEHDAWLRKVSSALGLEWADARAAATRVREALCADAWCTALE
jgi:hypothetical protein